MTPLFLALSLHLALAAISPDRVGSADTDKTIPVTLPSGTILRAEVMRTPQETALGLMYRPSLPKDRVLLFVFGTIDFHAIWMKNCRFPIDIVWLDEERRIVHVTEAVPPCRHDPCPSYAPMRKALYVVEMNAGTARREKLTIGATLGFNLEPTAR